ncbi:MAG: hypothetical protein HY540_01695 [Deltaproteobacteria bacterium]|nr:hypothetical protein [Deltaproteobacteria bacterium]
MKKIFGVMLAVAMMSSASGVAKAATLENGKNDRQGFFIGFGVGGGAMHLRGAGAKKTKGAFLGDLKIGGAVNEKVLLMFDNSLSMASIDDVLFDVSAGLFAVQWFPVENFYVRPGVGINFASASVQVNGTTISTDSDPSVSAEMSSGYEFRIGKSFSMGPELTYRYAHIRSNLSKAHSHSFGAQASFMWYF